MSWRRAKRWTKFCGRNDLERRVSLVGGERIQKALEVFWRWKTFVAITRGCFHPWQLLGCHRLNEGAAPVRIIEHRGADVDDFGHADNACKHPCLAVGTEVVIELRALDATLLRFTGCHAESLRRDHRCQGIGAGAHSLAAPAVARRRHDGSCRDLNVDVAAAALTGKWKLGGVHRFGVVLSSVSQNGGLLGDGSGTARPLPAPCRDLRRFKDVA